MGLRGPPRKPTHLKKLENNPGCYPLNENEPEFQQSAVMPLEVQRDPIARSEWERRYNELQQLGLLTSQDQSEFAEYCLQHSLCIQLWIKQKKLGIEKAILRGIYKARQTAVAARLRLASRFGFTPADRTQIKVKPEMRDAVAEFAKKKGQLVLMHGQKKEI